MRLARTIPIVALLLALPTLVSAQGPEPQATEPPDIFPEAKVSANLSGYDEPEVNRIIDRAARTAARVIDGKKLKALTLTPARTISQAARDWAEDGFDLVLISGGHEPDNILAALAHSDTTFIDIGQRTPCVTSDGRPDPSDTCAGGTSALPFNYMAISFAEDEAAYLAGIIAAAASRNDRLGIIGGSTDCEPCNRYMQGFELGARSLKPDIRIDKTFIAEGDPETGFTDAETARVFAETFIDVYQPDVLFPVARANSLDIHEVACDLGVRIIGSDLDLAARHPELAECVLTSAVKPIAEAVTDSVFDFSSERLQRVKRYDLANGGVSITPEWQQVPGLPVDLFAQVSAAVDEIRAGLAVTCTDYCGTRRPPAERSVSDESEATEPEA